MKKKTSSTQKKRIKHNFSLPTIVKGHKKSTDSKDFPVPYYSYSSLVKFSTNPILFKINYINRDRFDTAMGASAVLGQAFHKALEVYYGGSDEIIISDESEAIQEGLKVGMEFLENYNDGFINFSATIPNKQKMFELLSFCFSSYVKEKPWNKNETLVSIEEEITEKIEVEWRGQKLSLPIKLKGYLDKIVIEDEKLKIKDYKTCYNFSNPEKIDGAKIIQAVQYYLLVYASKGRAPYSIIFEEVKYTKNRDNSPQVREYEIVYEENDQFFDFYFRLYEDVTRALNGEAVFVPNISAMFDNEVAMIAYIHRLDVEEELAKQMKKLKVDNISDLLKKKIQNAGNMRKLMKAVEAQFVSAKNINYDKMTNHEKIQTKMLEHGMMIQFDSLIEGNTVDLYRYAPSIGLKMAKLKNYLADIEQVLGISGVRILAPIPGTSLIGFEVPRKQRTFPTLPKTTKDFNLRIGVDVMGDDYLFDIREAPHMLVAGSTGSGKSIFVSSIITQLNRLTKKEVEIHLFDPKMVELAQHRHDKNVIEYEKDIMKIYKSLVALKEEMDNRYEILAQNEKRSIQEYDGHMPYKFVFIDEFGDLIVQDYVHTKHEATGKIFQSGPRAGEAEIKKTEINISKEITKYILLLAQKSRACGIHLIISTQRPSTDIITGSIKTNFPTKVALRTAKAVDSQVIIDSSGAEKLVGKGDMIFSSSEGEVRLQGYKIQL